MSSEEQQLRDRYYNDVKGPSASASGSNSMLAIGWRIGVEMIAAIAVCVLIGRAIDSWLDSYPWALIVMFFLGAMAGLRNVYRTTRVMFTNPK